MPGANVQSVDSLRQFRAALWKFRETAQVAMTESEAEVGKVLMWLESEQPTYWRGMIRKRQEELTRAKEALRQKQLYKDSSGRSPPAVEELKAVRLATARLAEAEAKLQATRRHALRLQKEMHNYKGSVQRLATNVQADIPAASNQLDGLIVALEQYLGLTPPPSEVRSDVTSEGSMRQGGEAQPQNPPPTTTTEQ